MRSRKLGSSGPEISRVGFGAWAIGGPWKFGWGPVDDAESIAAIRYAVESGVTWVDTAAVYGLGHSEEIVAQALEPWRVGEEVYVFTKCGRNWYGKGGEVEHDLRPESIRFECDQSLKRLRVERIDLYQFHWPDPVTGTPVEESWATMVELVEEGKVRWIGVSNFGVDLLERCERIRHVDSAQPRFNLLDRSARQDVIPWCRDHGIGVIVYSPLASGLLTGAFDRERIENLPEDDWRRRASHFQEPQLTRNLALVERLQEITARIGTTPATLAIAWALGEPGVAAAIVGARRPRHVDGWLPAADLELGDDDLAQIERALEETGARQPAAAPPAR
jgi:aryl-alcohol dehydrogenase-like predicted oxidoreductase